LKRTLAIVLVLAMIFGLTACNRRNTGSQGDGSDIDDPYGQYTDYTDRSQAIYDDALGEFYTAYERAKAAENVSMRYALMAVAEAKLLASAVFLPLNSSGGNYAISRLAPYTVPSVLWGNDAERLHNALVTTAPITVAHREEMKQKWYELKGTGEYEQWARN
jgi:predicted small secreted protein